MKLGVFQFSTDYSMRPDHVARAAEERGFESIFYPEHTHIPVSRKSPWPGGKELPKQYWHTNDLFIAPPVLVGGSSAAARSRAVAFGEGWMPIPGRGESLGAAIQDLRARAEKAGRDPIPVTVFGVRPDEKTIAEYRELGVDRGLFGLPPATADSVLPLLDGYAKLLGK